MAASKLKWLVDIDGKVSPKIGRGLDAIERKFRVVDGAAKKHDRSTETRARKASRAERLARTSWMKEIQLRQRMARADRAASGGRLGPSIVVDPLLRHEAHAQKAAQAARVKADKQARQAQARAARIKAQEQARFAKMIRSDRRVSGPPAWMRALDENRRTHRTRRTGSGGPTVKVDAAYQKQVAASVRQVRQVRRSASAFDGLSDAAQKAFYWLELAKGAFAAISGAVSTVVGAARFAMDVGGQKTRTMRGLELGLGANAATAFADTQRFANEFGQDLEKTQSRFLNFINRGFEKSDAFTAMQAVADLEATGTEGIDDIIMAMAQIRSKGTASMEEIQQQLGEKMNVGGILEKVAARMGLSEDLAGQTKVRKLISQGAVAGETAYLAVLDYIAATKSKNGVLGATAKDAAKDIGNLEKVLLDRPRMFLQNIDMTKGNSAYQGFLDNLVRLTAPGSTFGNRIQAVFQRLFDSIANVFARYTGQDGAQKLEQDLGKVINAMERFAGAIEKISNAFNAVFGPLMDVTGTSMGKLSTGQRLFKMLLLSQGAYRTVDDQLSDDPQLATGGITTGPTRAIIGERGPEAIIPLRKLPGIVAKSGGGARPVNVQVVVNASGAEGREAGEVIAARIEPTIRTTLAKMLEELALENAAVA